MFWRREGSRFDGKAGVFSWILRILIFIFVAIGVVLMVRLYLGRAEAETAVPDAFDAGWRGEKVCELLFENDDMRAARCTFPPGVGHEKHVHRPHWGYILEGGVMKITDAGGAREQETPAGGSWWSDGGVHEALNVGETTTSYIIMEPKGSEQ